MDEMNVARAKEFFASNCFIDDDLLLTNSFPEMETPVKSTRMQCLFLALCTHGRAVYHVNTTRFEVGAGDVIIISEGQVLSDYELSSDCRGIGLIMSYDFFKNIIGGIHELSALFLFSRMHPVFRLNEQEMANIFSYITIIRQKVARTEHHFRRELVTALLKALIYDVSNAIYRLQQTSNKKMTRAESIFTEFIHLLEQNYKHERRVGWYAKELNITPKYLSETVRSISKRTPNDWIDNYVVMEIRVMLKDSALSIKEIAQQLNFSNQSFFGKYFKQHTGLTPNHFRKS